MHPGLEGGGEGQSGDDWGDPRVPVALRQPSRGLQTQKRCRHGANLPMEEGTGLELRQNRGLKGFQAVTGTRGQSGRDSGDHRIAKVTCPRQSHKPGLQSCSHRGSSRVQCWGSVPLPACPLLRDSCPVSKGLFAERSAGRKGQHPEPQPASCHQGPCHLADNKPWDKLRLERETQSKA